MPFFLFFLDFLFFFFFFFNALHFFFFLDVKGSGGPGSSSPGWKAVNRQNINLAVSVGNIRLSAFNIWIVSRNPSIHHISPLLRRLQHRLPVKVHTHFAVLLHMFFANRDTHKIYNIHAWCERMKLEHRRFLCNTNREGFAKDVQALLFIEGENCGSFNWKKAQTIFFFSSKLAFF